MLLYPSQDKLLEKIDSKYSLCILASKRAHYMRMKEYDEEKRKEKNLFPRMLDEYQSVKEVGQALEEIAEGDLVIDPESIKPNRQ